MKKKYSLLRLEFGANKVILECEAESVEEAATKFNPHLTNMPPLDKNGYCKLNETVSFCIAEQFNPFASCYKITWQWSKPYYYTFMLKKTWPILIIILLLIMGSCQAYCLKARATGKKTQIQIVHKTKL